MTAAAAATALYDQFDRSLARVRAVVAIQAAALEGAPGAIPDGTHFHVGQIVEDLLAEAQEAAQGLFEATRTIAPESAPSSAD